MFFFSLNSFSFIIFAADFSDVYMLKKKRERRRRRRKKKRQSKRR
jgi:hypothetical protein